MPDLQPAILCGRETFADIYRAQAAAMAERMGKLREKEVGKREAFIRYEQSTLTPSNYKSIFFSSLDEESIWRR